MTIELGPVMIGVAVALFGIVAAALVETERNYAWMPIVGDRSIWAVRGAFALGVLLAIGLYGIDAAFPCAGIGFAVGYLISVGYDAAWPRIYRRLAPLAGRDLPSPEKGSKDR